MFWAIISTFLSSIAKVFFKKTTHYNIKAELNDLFGHIWAFLWLIVIIILGQFNILLNSWWDYLLVFITIIFYVVNTKINQFVLTNESISSIIPYENLSKILTVLFWVFILKDEISNVALLFFILTIITIFIFSVDFKKLKLSTTIIVFCFWQLLLAFASLIIAYLLIHNSSVDYYSVYTLISFGFVLFLCIYFRYFNNINTLDTKYYINRWISSLQWISWIIWILLIKELWLSVTTLLSFLWIGISLITSYIVFKDIPSKKNTILTLLVLTFITIWYIYK